MLGKMLIILALSESVALGGNGNTFTTGLDADVALVSTDPDELSSAEARERVEFSYKPLPPDGESVPDADDSAIRFHDNRNDAAPQGDNSLFSSSDGTLNETESESQEETETESDDENNWKSKTDSRDQNETKIENERKEPNERRYERQSENETESESENAVEAKSDRYSMLRFLGNQREAGSWKNPKFTPKRQESLLKNSSLTSGEIHLFSSFRFRTNSESETSPSRITGDAPLAAETSSNRRSETIVTNQRKRSLRNGQTVSNQSCETLQCLRGGECSMNRDGNRFPRCLCPMGTRGSRCQEDVVVRQPRFLGSGYIAFPVPTGTGSVPLSVTVSFRPDPETGMLDRSHPSQLLLFASSSSFHLLDGGGHRDFISVALINGFAEFRFNCGSGVVPVRSVNRVEFGQWNTIHARQSKRNGMVRLNDGPVSRNSAKGSFTELTLGREIFLGGHPNATDRLRRIVGLDSREAEPEVGFVGCVRSLQVNGKPYDLRRGAFIGDAVYGMDVDDCSSELCANITCLNGGKPSPNVQQTICQCLCPLGTIGDTCQSKVDIYIPLFSGHSFLRYQALGKPVLVRMDIEIILKTSSPNGLILYNAYSGDRTSDFLLLALSDGFLLFTFDLGSGPAVIRSRQRILVNEWHAVRLVRNGRSGQLIVDGHGSVDTMSPGPFTQLNVMLDLFIGGHRDLDELPKVVEVNESFTGCIQMVRVNQRRLYLIDEAVEGINIDNCNHPCVGQPCTKAALCVPLRDLYQCLSCTADDATNCEDGNILHRYRYRYRREPTLTVPLFSGSSYIEYNDPRLIKLSRGHQTDVDLHLRASGADGLVFWIGEEQTDSDSDFLSISLSSGFVQLRFNLGSGEVTLTWTEFRLDDDKWHRVTARRFEQQGSLDVDGLRIVTGSSAGPLKQLNTSPTIFLGGMSDIWRQTLGRFTSGFSGCISNLTLDSDVRVRLIEDAADVVNVTECSNNTTSSISSREDAIG